MAVVWHINLWAGRLPFTSGMLNLWLAAPRPIPSGLLGSPQVGKCSGRGVMAINTATIPYAKFPNPKPWAVGSGLGHTFPLWLDQGQSQAHFPSPPPRDWVGPYLLPCMGPGRPLFPSMLPDGAQCACLESGGDHRWDPACRPSGHYLSNGLSVIAVSEH